MPTVNLRPILFPRVSKSASSDIYKQLSDSFRLREQKAAMSGWGDIRTPEALNDIIEKNKNELFANFDKLDANQIRDLGSQINRLEIQGLGMMTEQALDTDDIKESVEKSKNLLKANYVSNPYEYAKQMKQFYDIALDGDSDFEGIRERIKVLGDNELNISGLEELRDNYEKERGKFDEIVTGFDQKRQSKLDAYALVYEMSMGRVRNIEFVRSPEKKGVMTDMKYNFENEKSKLNQEQGIPVRLIDTQVNKLPDEKEISFGFYPFKYTGKVLTAPAQYTFQGDIDTFDYSTIEWEGIESRSVGDILKGSNDRMYYVDRNKDLRPIMDEKNYRMLQRGGKGIKNLTPNEEEKLSYLVKEPFDMFKSHSQGQELRGMASQLSGKISSKIFGPVSAPAVPKAGFRPTEYEYQKRALLEQTGKMKTIERTKAIIKGAWGAFK